ncbi:ribose 5-phosphate isomerase, putative [Eimeria praecox]|uniref:ribose-5-phosphate isomerase n=1 Tax=Eimeria praecox TaxID=51316 RepID=U6G7I3_9EIME|nr:ribose 5-phosphate isomerase, putative [Eimeria praecox]
MRVGLGTGSTASFAVRRLGERIQQGELTGISCASTSEETRMLVGNCFLGDSFPVVPATATVLATAAAAAAAATYSFCYVVEDSSRRPCMREVSVQAESLGISVFPLDEISLPLDVAIDGADEVLKTDSGLVLIKGRGGALMREKLVEVNSKRFVCIVDEDKVIHHSAFGTTGALPLEIVQYGAQATRRAVLAAVVDALGEGGPQGGPHGGPPEDPERAAEELGVSAVYRHRKDSKELFVTDNGNLCLDLFFKKAIKNPHKLHQKLINVVGVVETGLFIGLTDFCIVGHPSGNTTQLTLS